MLQVTAEEITRALPIADAIDVVERAMCELSQGHTDQPPRWIMRLPDNNGMGIMPGAMQEPYVHGMKLISLYPENPKRGLSSHQGVMLLFDTDTGTPIACLDAAELTALRTAAATAAATRVLAREDARTLAILGAGEQADHHLPALMRVRSFERVRVWTRTGEHAEAFAARHADQAPALEVAESARAAVSDADVIVTVTASKTPVLQGAWLQAGQHINLVGASVASSREIDEDGVGRGLYFVESISAAESQAGEFLAAQKAGVVGHDHILGEIGDVLQGRVAGRRSAQDVTMYKALGTAAQDLATGHEIWRRLRDTH